MNFSSISLDHNPYSSVDTPSPSSSPFRLQTRDYSKYLRKFAGINVSYVPATVICIGFDILFTLITLVMGGSNLSSCPIQPFIPIYLVVSATVNLVSIVFTIIGCALHFKKKSEHMIGFRCIMLCAVVILILQIFNYIWLICGTVWTYGIIGEVQYAQKHDNPNGYCHEVLYKYTLVSIVLQYIIPIVLCCVRNVHHQ